jgi:hypothetical protein
VIFVAKSAGQQDWANSVGLTKHVYKVGFAEDSAEAAVERMNAERHAGFDDWRALKKQKVDSIDEAAALARLAEKERAVDPAYYPKLRGAAGVFKVRLEIVENSMVVKAALSGAAELKAPKPKPADVATYLIANARGQGE